MSGRRREGLSPNMFPFLAVLICTLGTLILMLALIAQDPGEADASSLDSGPSAEELAKQQQMIEADAEIERRISEARWHREQVVKIRDEQTSEIDERRTKESHLRDHVKRLRDELARLEAEVEASQNKSSEKAVSQQDIDALNSKVEAEKSKIEKLRNEQQNATPRIVIVPHKGPNGTDRRPIYIECRADGVYIQPGDVSIAPRYLESNIPGLNPLDAALDTIRLYAMKHYGDVDAPYPLIVVRPDGIETYAAVRFAMKGWEDQFGYELVPNEVKLAFPEPDVVMNEKVDDAIAQAVRQQEAYFAGTGGMGGRGGRGPSGGGTASNINGPSGVEPRENQAGSSDAKTRATNAAGISRVPRRIEDLPVLSARNMDADMAAKLESGNFGSGRGQAIPSRFAARSTGSSAVASDANAGENASYAGLNPQNFEPNGTESSNTESGADRFGAPSDVESKSNRPTTSIDPNAPMGGSLASGAPSEVNPIGTTTPPAEPIQNERMADEPPSGTPNLSMNKQMNGQGAQSPKVKRGGKDWALPSHVAERIGTKMVRSIRAECHADRLVLLPEGGKGATNVYDFSDGNIDRATIELATAIRDRVDGWGAGMPGGRWQPLLEVNVAQGGDFRFRQLQTLMRGSGVDIEAKGTPK